MIKLKVAAAAFAAGMIAFAANAQERVENPKVLAQKAAKKASAAKAQKTTKEAETCPYLFGCGSAKNAAEKAGQPKVDKVQTASVSKRVSPSPIAKAKKDVKGAEKPAAGKTSAKKAGRPKVDKVQTASVSKRVSPSPIAKAKKDVKGAEKPAARKTSAKKAGRPNVDKVQTASVSKRVSPKLVAKARKDVKGAEKPAAGIAEAEKLAAGEAMVSNMQYGSIVARYAASYGVPVSLAHAVIRIESNYRVDARGSAGEIGLMQIKPATARMMGYSGSSEDLYNPETNIKFGIKYLSVAHKLGGGTTCGTILKYNAGHAAKRMNPISAAYCSKVKRHLAGA